MSDLGWQALVDYGVRLAIDLRGDDEVEDDPPADVPIEIVRQPMPGRRVPVVWEWPSMRDAYVGLLGGFQRELTEAVVTVARADEPVVVHCLGGRDRTGLVCGLMLRLAGVSLETIAGDHALSDASWAAHNARWCESAPDEWERERRRRVTTPAGTTMAEVLADLDVEGYLLGGGASLDDLDTLVIRLRA